MNCVPDIGMPMAMDFLVVPGPLHVLPFEMRVLAIDKNGESSPYEHSLVDKTFHHVAMLRPLSGTNSPTGGLARLRIAMQKSKGCDERTTGCQLESSPSRARVCIQGRDCWQALLTVTPAC